jgi:hypothetical protein
MSFDLSQYETVHERLERFWKQYPNGRVNTELIAYSDTQFIVKAEMYKDLNDEKPFATGYAEERVGSTFINKTSALENCETSAIGRCASNGSLVPASSGKQKPSVTEMQKSNRYESANGDVPKEEWKSTARGAWADVGQPSEKQVNFVKKIVKDAFTSTGFQDDEKSWNYIGEWVKSYKPINKAEDLDSKMASMIINDKMKTTGVTKLIQYLQSKQDPEKDPWATPANF